MSAVDAGAGPHVDHVVGGTDCILVVFDDDNGIADIAQALERLDQALVVTLMKTDRGLIQNIEHAHETRADLRCQANTLRLATRKRRRGTIERQIVESNIDQKTQALQDFLDDAPADKLLALGELQALKKLERLTARQATNLVNGLAAHGDGEHLRAQTSAVAARARLLANVLLQARLGVLVRRLGIAFVQDVANARKLGIPLATTSVELLVVNRDLRIAQAIQECTTYARGQVLPRRIGAHLKVFTDRSKNLRVVVRIAKQATKDSVGNGLRGVLDQRLGINGFLKAQAIALRTCAIGSVKRKITRLKIVNGVSMLRARQGQRILQQLALGPLGSITIGQHVHVYIAVSQRGRLLNRLGDTAQRILTDHDAIDHDLDIVLELLVQIDRIVERAHFTVDTHAAKALGAKVLKQFGVLAFSPAHHRCQHKRAAALPRRQDLVGNLVGRLTLNDAAAFGTVRGAHTGEQQAQIVINLGYGANRRARVFRRRLLVDRHRRRKAVD